MSSRCIAGVNQVQNGADHEQSKVRCLMAFCLFDQPEGGFSDLHDENSIQRTRRRYRNILQNNTMRWTFVWLTH